MVDTVNITVEGDLAYVTIPFSDTTVVIGDSIQYTAIAYDSQGDEVSALFTWISSDPRIVEIEATTGLAVTVGKGSASILVRAERTGGLHLARRFLGGLIWDSPHNIMVGDTIHFCAYLLDPEGSILTYDPPDCPIPFPLRQEPAPSVFAVLPRHRPIFLRGN